MRTLVLTTIVQEGLFLTLEGIPSLPVMSAGQEVKKNLLNGTKTTKKKESDRGFNPSKFYPKTKKEVLVLYTI